jgi:hypothetical protein
MSSVVHFRYLLPELGECIVGAEHGHVEGVPQVRRLVQLQALVQISQLLHIQQFCKTIYT